MLIIAGGRLRRRLEVVSASRPTAMRVLFSGPVPKPFLDGLAALDVRAAAPEGAEVDLILPQKGDPRPEIAALAAGSGGLLSFAPQSTALEDEYLTTIKAAEEEAAEESAKVAK